MNIKQIFEVGIKMAMAADPRGEAAVKKYLANIRKEYDKLSDLTKKYFEKEKLTNPYLDSFIHVDNGAEVKRILAGIDINPGEILLANELNQRGKKIDLVIAHHPEGKGLTYLHDVMGMNTDIYEACGIPVHLAEKISEERWSEVEKGVHHMNHNQTIDIARLLDINFINTHTFTDNLVHKFLGDYLQKVKPQTLGEIIEALLELPEYQYAQSMGSGPKIVSGRPNHRVGKMLLEMTGGTTPASKLYQEISRFGISTVVGMHMHREVITKATENQLSVIMAGHMSSDSLGMNLLLDEYEKRGIEIVPCGGLIRVSRVKKSKPAPKVKPAKKKKK